MTPTWRQSDRGSVTAELTILTPLLILLLVFIAVAAHRGVSARIQLDSAAHQAARAASLERSGSSAASAARAAAAAALADTGTNCTSMHVSATETRLTNGGGIVTVAVACSVDITDTLLTGIPAATLSATAVEPIDTWRSSVDGGHR